MKKISSVIVILSLALISILSINVEAAENEFGTVYAWVKIHEGEWQNATVHETLKIFELFDVKVTISTKKECHVSLSIYCPGSTVAYEVIEGPSEYDISITNMDCPIGWNKTYEWTVRPNDNWTDGYSPLNIFVQFTETMDNLETESFTLIRAFIEDEIWEGYTPEDSDDNSDDNQGDNNSGNDSTPGFEFIFVLFVFCVAVLGKRYKINKK